MAFVWFLSFLFVLCWALFWGLFGSVLGFGSIWFYLQATAALKNIGIVYDKEKQKQSLQKVTLIRVWFIP